MKSWEREACDAFGPIVHEQKYSVHVFEGLQVMLTQVQ